MKTRRITSIALFVCLSLVVKAQQTPLVNHTYVNNYLANPAYAGDKGTNLFLLNRLQWADVNGAPETFVASIDGMVGNTNLGYGLMIMNDVNNIVGKSGIFGTYSYKLGLDDKSQLAFGLSLGFEQNKLLFDRISALNPTEIALINNIESQSNFDANAGLTYTRENLNVGLSSYQLFANRNGFQDENTQAEYTYAFMRHYVANAGYRVVLDPDKVYLDPSVLVRFASDIKPQTDINMMLNFSNIAWLGVGFRTDYGANFMAGGVLGRKLVASYSYGRSVGPIEKLSANSHEFILGYKFNGVMDKKDADNDGVYDAMDKQPDTPEGCEVDVYGVALDADIDGVPNCLDQELNTPLGAPVDEQGVALDDDHDGVINLYDREPNSPKDCPVDRLGVSVDTDMDGVSDCKDMQLKTPLGAEVDENGVALDADNDGVADLYDLEPNTPHHKHLGVSEILDASDCVVDSRGVAKDSDNDGVSDCVDLDNETPTGAEVDSRGRAKDTDGDGVPNGIDRDNNTPEGAKVDKWGVSVPDPDALDDDNDGVPNAKDLEPNTPENTKVDELGRAIKIHNPITENKLEIKDMEDNSTEWEYYMVVGVFKNQSNVKGYQAKLQTKYGERTRVLLTDAGYHYVYTKTVETREEAYKEAKRLTNKKLEDFIVGNPWLWKEPKKE
ncbi:MAG: PorP/SprF family type IX secretion system membrane protein [Bacteroidia bacterium]|nr:PorP/SprF family type IX secretion system membrane protein [Bacteroidia bacterium]